MDRAPGSGREDAGRPGDSIAGRQLLRAGRRDRVHAEHGARRAGVGAGIRGQRQSRRQARGLPERGDWGQPRGTGGFRGCSHRPWRVLSLGVEARWPSYSLALEGRLDVPSQVSLGQGDLKSSLWMATLVPCFGPGWLGICGLLAAGMQRRRGGRRAGRGTAASAPYLAPGLRLALVVPMGSVCSATQGRRADSRP